MLFLFLSSLRLFDVIRWNGKKFGELKFIPLISF